MNAAVTLEVLSEVTMLPPESTTSTTGWGVGTPLTAPRIGAEESASFFATPTDTVIVPDGVVVAESVASLNVKV